MTFRGLEGTRLSVNYSAVISPSVTISCSGDHICPSLVPYTNNSAADIAKVLQEYFKLDVRTSFIPKRTKMVEGTEVSNK
jgi:hypothetical protein